MYKIFTEEQGDQICDMYLYGFSTFELAEIYGCDHSTIRCIVKRSGITLRTLSEAQKIFSKEYELQIRKQYVEDKLNIYELAKIHGCDPTTIGCIVKRNGGTLRTRGEANKGRKVSKKAKQKLRDKALDRIQTHSGPYKDTKPELKMEEILIFLHIPYEKQFRVDNHLADFHFLNTNILAEVDGDYYHGNPKKFSKFNKMQLKQKERDIKNDQIAKKLGYTVLRFWENDILNNEEFVKRTIIQKLSN